jgi:endoglucanase
MKGAYIIPKPGIYLNQSGYRPSDSKTALVACDADYFEVYRGDGVFMGRKALTGDSQSLDANSGEILKAADFSHLVKPGAYYIQAHELRSPVFEIRHDAYQNLTASLIKFFYFQRCGGEGVKAELCGQTFAHPSCHTEPAVYYDQQDIIYGLDEVDVSGGWHDAGDYGRYVTPGVKAVMDLLLACEHYPALKTLDIGLPHSVLDEVRYELQWLLKMQHPRTGGVYHKVTTEYHASMNTLPEDDWHQLYLAPVSAPATGAFAAVMAFASRMMAPSDPDFSKQCLEASKKAWQWLVVHPEVDGYSDPDFFKTGKYGDASSADERFWAAAELYKTTGEDCYKAYMLDSPFPSFGLGWANMGTYAMIALVTSHQLSRTDTLYMKAKEMLLRDAADIIAISSKNGFGIGLNRFVWGSNMDVANCAMLLLMANRIQPDKAYVCAAKNHIDYLLGRNPMGMSYVTGCGQHAAQHPHHRPSMILGATVPGMLVGGPNAFIKKLGRDPASLLVPENTPPMKCYIDMYESFALNEICIYWNSPLVYATGAFL